VDRDNLPHAACTHRDIHLPKCFQDTVLALTRLTIAPVGLTEIAITHILVREVILPRDIIDLIIAFIPDLEATLLADTEAVTAPPYVVTIHLHAVVATRLHIAMIRLLVIMIHLPAAMIRLPVAVIRLLIVAIHRYEIVIVHINVVDRQFITATSSRIGLGEDLEATLQSMIALVIQAYRPVVNVVRVQPADALWIPVGLICLVPRGLEADMVLP
jgi:hypothetical protein